MVDRKHDNRESAAPRGGLDEARRRALHRERARRKVHKAKLRLTKRSLPGAVLLELAELRRVLDPATFATASVQKRWMQCRYAAAAALMVCCNLSAIEVVDLLFDDFMPGGEAVIRVRRTGNRSDFRTVPLIGPAVCVVQRYLDERPPALAGATHLLLQPDGRPMKSLQLLDSLQRAGVRLGLTGDLPAALRATFHAAVRQDPSHDGAVHYLLRLNPARDGIVTAPPSPARLRTLLEKQHPLAPFGRIRLFETARPATPLLREMLGCTETRNLADGEIQHLRRTLLPEAAKHVGVGHVTMAQAARWFGVSKECFRGWIRQYRKFGVRATRGPASGRMTADWRTKVTERYDALVPLRSVSAFYDELKKSDFPYSYDTLRLFMRDHGMGRTEMGPGVVVARKTLPDRSVLTTPPPPCAVCGFRDAAALREHLGSMDIRSSGGRLAWRQVLAREARRRKPRSVRSFHIAMKTEVGFRSGMGALNRFLTEVGILIGWSQAKPKAAEWRRRLPEEVLKLRPTSAKACHREMVLLGFPGARPLMLRWLAEAGIAIGPDGPVFTGPRGVDRRAA